jgi:hypothetical protein
MPAWELAIDELECCLVQVFAYWAGQKLGDENPDDPFDKIPTWDASVDGPRVGGKEFMEKFMSPAVIAENSPEWKAREEAIYEQITKGNIPDFMREPQYVHVTFKGDDGQVHVASYRVMPDYLAIGTNDDYVLVPMSGRTAQRICDTMGFTLPTAQMVDQIYGTAQKTGTAITGEPRHYYKAQLPSTSGADMQHLQDFRTANGLDTMTDTQKKGLQMSTWAYAEHDLAIKDGRPGQSSLVAGHKKDIIAAEHGPGREGKLAIYGLYDSKGVPMNAVEAQDGSRMKGIPFYSNHSQDYSDYSHGARMVDQYMMLDGKMMKVADVMADPEMAKGITGLEGDMKDAGRVPGVPRP